MNRTIYAVAAAFVAATPTHADTLATFEFTNQSLAPTLGTFAITNGVTVSDLSVGNYANLFDNGSDENFLRISGNDSPHKLSVDALANGDFLSFTVTIPATTSINLDTISMDIAGHNLFGGEPFSGHTARIYTSLQGFDDILEDTVGVFGFPVPLSGTDFPLATQTRGLSDLSINLATGANVQGTDFVGLTDTAIVFYLPFKDGSATAQRWIDVDSVTITASIPEPASLAIAAACFCTLLARRTGRM